MRRIHQSQKQSNQSELSIKLHSFSLVFSDAELEDAFELNQTKEDYVPTSIWFMISSFVVLSVNKYFSETPESWIIGSHLAALLFAQASILWLAPLKIWTLYSFPFHFCMRLTRLALFIWWLPVWVIPEGKTNIFLSLINRSGMTILFWHGWGYKLLFHKHILLHGLLTGFTTIALCPFVCISHAHLPQTQNWIPFVWDLSNSIFDPLEKNSFFDVDLVDKCSILLMMAHAFYAFALPTSLIWAMEIQSRHQFVEQMAITEKWRNIQLNSCWNPEVVQTSGTLTSLNNNLDSFSVIGIIVLSFISVCLLGVSASHAI